MGTVYNRGTKHKPKWWCGYKDRDGAWKYISSGQPTKEQARQLLNKLESNVSAGLAGIERRTEAQLCGALLDDWSPTLSNRNARDDRYRLENHLRPAFGETNVRDVDLKAILAWLEAQKQGKAPRREKPAKPKPAPIATADGKKEAGAEAQAEGAEARE